MDLPIYKLTINEDDFETGVDFISLVENPAIQKDFLKFNQQFVEPNANETQDEFIARCVKYVIDEAKDSEQAVAICYSMWENKQSMAFTCPIATQDIPTNLKHRQNAIDNAHYGPLDPNQPNEDYWKAKAKMFNDSVDNAKKALCSNCSFFNVSKNIEDCIAKAIGNEGGDPYAVIDAGKIGYCEAWDFKCAGSRTCDAWVAGGPVTMKDEFKIGDKVSFDFDNTLNTPKGQILAKNEIDNGSTVYIISARNSKDGMLNLATKLGIPSNRVYATGTNDNKVAKIKELGIIRHYDNNKDVIDMLGSVGQKFDIIATNLPTYIKQLPKLKKKFESYSDYPESVKNNAKKVLKWTEENGWGNCGTPVGKQRANQLANGEPISFDTIKRMYSYLSRHKVDLESSKSYEDGCGLLMYDSWGGEEALKWSENKINQIENKLKFAIQSEEKRIISGAAMLADLPIYRRDEVRGEYYVVFDKQTIYQIAKKWAIKNKYNSVNVDHSQVINGLILFESYLLDFERGIMPPKGFEDAKDGSWFVSYYVENDVIWNEIKLGTWKGFSVEGFFDFVEPKSQEDMVLEQLKSIISKWSGK